MASLKVLELNTEKTWRGGERHTYCTLKALKSLGIDVDLLARRDSPLAKKAKGLNITVYEVSNHLEALGFLIGRGKKYDVIHAQTPKTQSIALFSKPIHRRPIVCTRLVDFKPKGVLSRAKYKLTDRMVAINETIKDVLISAGVEKVEVIPIMYEPKKANTERARTLLRELGIDTAGKKVIATVSAFTPQKDPLTTVKVVEELSRRRRDFLFLHFGDGPMRSEVEREITDRDLEGFYHILGFVEDPEDFYPLFDVYVMTSLNEGTPLSVLDAFHFGVPVVSTDIPPMRETVSERGFLCPVGDWVCIAERIDALLSDPSLKADVVKVAHEWVKRTFSLERLGKRYVKLFMTLSGR